MLTEIENYLLRIEDLHRQVIGLIEALPEEALNWRPFEGGEAVESNSFAVLVSHIAGAEHFWVGEVIGGRPPTRKREDEFRVRVNQTRELVTILKKTEAETREVLTSLSPADLDGERIADGRTVAVRWGLLHVIDHTALHLGHLQLSYQLWNGGRSRQAPLWHERLPKKM